MTLSTAGKLGMGAFTPVDRMIWNKSGATVALGELVVLDHLATATGVVQGDVEDGRPGMDSAIESNVVTPVTVLLKSGVFAVVIGLGSSAGVDASKVLVRFRGLVDVLYVDTAPLDAGEPLYAVNGVRTGLADIGEDAAVLGQKYLGFLREDVTGSGTSLGSTMFDGVHGTGSAKGPDVI